MKGLVPDNRAVRIVRVDEFCQYSGYSKGKLYVDLSNGVEIPGAFKPKNFKRWHFDLNKYDAAMRGYSNESAK